MACLSCGFYEDYLTSSKKTFQLESELLSHFALKFSAVLRCLGSGGQRDSLARPQLQRPDLQFVQLAYLALELTFRLVFWLLLVLSLIVLSSLSLTPFSLTGTLEIPDKSEATSGSSSMCAMTLSVSWCNGEVRF